MRNAFVVLALSFLALLMWSDPAAAQGDGCGVCILYPIAGLHRAALQGASVQNGHDELVDGTCGEWHGHYPCDITEDDADLLAALRSEEPPSPEAVRSFLNRHANRVTFITGRTGFNFESCGADPEMNFVPVPGDIWVTLIDLAPDNTGT